jgi:hypothetical protein
MAKIEQNGARGRLAETERRLRAWREGRRRGQRIPQELWQTAVELCEHFPLAEIAGRLALDYERLEKRVEARRGRGAVHGRGNAPIGGTGFVEVAKLGDGYPDACMIEAEDGSGGKLAVRLNGGACTQAAEIVKALWSERG